MANIESFLSEGFLQEFVKNLPRDFFSDDFLPNIELYRFLDKHTDVILGGRKEDYSELAQTDGLTRNLIDRYLQGDNSVKIEDWDIEKVRASNKLFKYCFLSSSNVSLKNELNQNGFATYHLNCNINLRKIIGYESIAVTRYGNFSNRLIGWKSLKTKLLPFHSIVIADNYQLTSPKQLDATILMLNTLISKGDTPIHLTIAYYNNQYKENDTILEHNWNDIKNKIKNSPISSYINISVCKFSSSSNFHDRIIITNSQLLMTGNSFSNFLHSNGRTKLPSPTIINLNSHCCNFSGNDWSEFASLMLKSLRILVRDSSKTMMGKPLNNPLFSL